MPASKGTNAVVSGEVPSYRRPRRRPAHLRTKTGCLTCRKRKKKCDETAQTCGNCAKQRLECIWQLNRRHNASGILPDRSFPKEAPNLSTLDVVDPKLGMMGTSISKNAQQSDSHLISFTSPQPVSCWSQIGHIDLSIEQKYFVTCGLSSALTPGSAPLFDFLTSRFLPQLIRPAATSRVIDLFSRESMAMAMKTPACMHALLACSGAEIPTKTSRFRNLAKFHYARAVNELRNDLKEDNIKNGWLRSKPRGSTGVEIHLTGAAQLIRIASEYCKIDHDSPEIEQAMHRLVYEAFIFHVATSLPFQYHTLDHCQVNAAFAIAETNLGGHFHSPLACYPDSPVLGAPPQLFRCIYTIYHLYRDIPPNDLDLEVCQKLENDLLRWSQSAAATAPSAYDYDGLENNVEKTDSVSWRQAAWKSQTAVIGPRLYVLGSRILLQRMVYSNISKAHSTIDELIQEAMSTVKQLQPDIDYFAEYYCWPFYVLGINLQHSVDRQCLMAQIWAFHEATNNGTMKRLSEILSTHWNNSQSTLPG
ncbi:uncharacterized protein N7511_000019 [Penicillium nucicola]|uniref:uncharacterized protein n=1 Tax=Penicillium nucicola TaxID=1850975 RepID=UPI002545A857|nr:uncharacterized protein N7511_000019 [Penicillium nucicola]KAJ5775008.1 hypothetical protein N7511_000019 [Penicillium nucicola]